LIPKETAKNRIAKFSQTKPEHNTPPVNGNGGGGGGSSSPGVMIGNRTRSQTQPKIVPAILPSSPPSSSLLTVMAIGGNSATNLNQLLPTVPSAPPVIPFLPLRTTTEPLNRPIPSTNPGTRPPARPQPPIPHSSSAHNRRRSRSVGDLASIIPKV
jgi:hypothetical protein